MKEHQHIEWKESWRDDGLRSICGFANADGGVLVIGRNDGGKVAGIDNGSRLLEELPNKVRDLLGIMVDVNLRIEGGREFLEISINSPPNMPRCPTTPTSPASSSAPRCSNRGAAASI